MNPHARASTHLVILPLCLSASSLLPIGVLLYHCSFMLCKHLFLSMSLSITPSPTLLRCSQILFRYLVSLSSDISSDAISDSKDAFKEREKIYIRTLPVFILPAI